MYCKGQGEATSGPNADKPGETCLPLCKQEKKGRVGLGDSRPLLNKPCGGEAVGHGLTPSLKPVAGHGLPPSLDEGTQTKSDQGRRPLVAFFLRRIEH